MRLSVEFRPGACSAVLPVARPSQRSSVQARRGPDSGVGTPLPPPTTHSTPGRQPHSETVTRESWHTRTPSQKVQPHPTPEKQPFGCRRQKTDFVQFLHSPGTDGSPSTSRLHFGRRQPGGGQGGTHSVLRRALLTAQVTTGASHPGGRVSLGANMGVRREPCGGPGASVGRKESQATGTGVFPTIVTMSAGTVRVAEVNKETAWHAWTSRTFSHRPSRVGQAGGQGQPGLLVQRVKGPQVRRSGP